MRHLYPEVEVIDELKNNTGQVSQLGESKCETSHQIFGTQSLVSYVVFDVASFESSVPASCLILAVF